MVLKLFSSLSLFKSIYSSILFKTLFISLNVNFLVLRHWKKSKVFKNTTNIIFMTQNNCEDTWGHVTTCNWTGSWTSLPASTPNFAAPSTSTTGETPSLRAAPSLTASSTTLSPWQRPLQETALPSPERVCGYLWISYHSSW